MSSFENNVEEIEFVTPSVAYATEVIVQDEQPIKPCQRGEEMTT
jgi:hypothetical protein